MSTTQLSARIGTPAPSEAVPLSQCPIDGYPLHGLPEEHRCPECGFRYDRRTRVWRAERWWAFSGLAVFSLVSLLTGLAAVRLLVFRPHVGMFVAAAVTIFWAGHTIRSAMSFRAGPFVAATPDGLVLRTVGREVQTIAGERIMDVQVDRRANRVFCLIQLAAPEERLDVSGMVRTPDHAEQLRDVVRQRFRSPDPPVRPTV